MEADQVKATWSLAALAAELEELTTRLGPRGEWFQYRLYVWSFPEFTTLLADSASRDKVQEVMKVVGVTVHEDKNLPKGAVEYRLVPKVTGAPKWVIQ